MKDIEKCERAYGICLGASTISAVQIKKCEGSRKPEVEKVIRHAHEGNPKSVFKKIVKELSINNDIPVMVTGRKFREFINLPSITEPEATEYALEYIKTNGEKKYDALVSAGGETFMVYALNHDHKINNISTGNKCASGTGEFFLQQIRRMNLDVEQAAELALKGTPYAVSGRCSVFCKSDCTHALNKGEPIPNVTAGLCEMIAQKILEILSKVRHERVMLIGGTALNRAVTKYLQKEIRHLDIPREASYFEALGAALVAFQQGRPLPKQIFHTEKTSFSFLPPLKDFKSLVTFKSIEYKKAVKGDRCLVGLDVGSTTTKAVVMRLRDHALLASIYLRTNGNPIEASRACYKGLLKGLKGVSVKIIGIGVTGSGRQIAGLYTLTDGIINEIIAHAAAAVYFDPEVDTIFEIGGQDAKYTYITNSVAADYAMNQACSAGTGSFLEEAAYESLGVRMEDIAKSALKGTNPPNFNDQCAAFISSDIKNAAHEGISLEDILAGIVYSICFNYNNRVKGNRPVGKKIFMQGGVCYNKAVPLAMAGVLRKPIVVPPEPGLMGAFGVALELEKRLEMGLLKENKFILQEIAQREIKHEKPFVCAGGKERCDLKCKITRVRIGDKIFPFGGACNRYYNLRFKTQDSDHGLDYVKARNQLMFGKYAPRRPVKPNALRIGLNTSFLTLSLFPLYYNFFSALGCKIILPDSMEQDAARHLVASMCYPAEISIGLFENLIKKRIDYIFIPFVKELYVPGGINKQDFCSTCGFSRGEAFVLRQAFAQHEIADKILSPYLNLYKSLEQAENVFVHTARCLGFSKKAAKTAFFIAQEAQLEFEAECKALGRKVLEEVSSSPDKTAVVLFGRPYNAYAPEANKGIPKKFTSRGTVIIPYDMLPYEQEPMAKEYAGYMHWETGQRVLKAAQIVKRDPHLFGVFITNFLCAPDSFIVPYFRKIMGSKPNLTLELDAHTADAGINTRVEAFLDIVKNYRSIADQITQKSEQFPLAKVSFENHGTFYVDSEGMRYKLTDPKLKLIVPSVGYFGNKGLSAVFRRMGINAEALPVSDNEVLHLGRSVTTGKECMPLMMCIGSLIKYLKNRPPQARNEKLMLLIPKAAGHCRLGQYHVFINQFIKDSGLKDVAQLDLSMDHKFAGMGVMTLYNAWRAIVIADVIDDIECTIRALAVDPVQGLKVLREQCDKICASLEGTSKVGLYRQLRESAECFRSIPLKQSLAESARVGVTGEFFVRRDHFSNLNIAHRLAEKGFVVSIASLTEVMYYVNFMIKRGIKKPAYTLTSWLELYISDKTQRHTEKKIKNILAASGLYNMELLDVEDLIRHSEYLIPNELDGEPGLISGLTMRDSLSKYSGIVNVGPFGCMQCRFGDAITIPQADVAGKKRVFKSIGKEPDFHGFHENERIPYLSVESDGNPYPQLLEARFESFCLAAARAAKKIGKKVAPAD
jgi:predicted CoA-substrate-specific enzyme activase